MKNITLGRVIFITEKKLQNSFKIKRDYLFVEIKIAFTSVEILSKLKNNVSSKVIDIKKIKN